MDEHTGELKKEPRIMPLLRRREMLTFVLLILVIIVSFSISENFRDMTYILKTTTRYLELAMLALTMTLVIIAGQIDLSVAALMSLTATVTAMLYSAGVPMAAACVIGLALGFLCGTVNGTLISYVGLPSMIVTIGTMNLFRGLSQVFIGDRSIGGFPEWFNSIEKIPVFRTAQNGVFGVTLLLFIVLSAVFFYILHKTTVGRKIYGLGLNEEAVRASGANARRLKCLLFSFSGLMAGLCGILTMSRLLLVRFDMHDGAELDVITMVLLGGADINGGSGSIAGTFIAVFIVVILKTGLIVAGVRAQDQMFIMGLLLLLSIIIPNVVQLIRDRKN